MADRTTVELQLTVLVDGKSYRGEIGKIASTYLGYEDHEIFSLNVQFDFGEVRRQGTGHYCIHPEMGGYGSDLIKRIIDVVGVRTWEALRGKQVIVLRDEDSFSGLIRGLADLTGTRTLLFSEHGDFWTAKKDGSS